MTSEKRERVTVLCSTSVLDLIFILLINQECLVLAKQFVHFSLFPSLGLAGNPFEMIVDQLPLCKSLPRRPGIPSILFAR